MNAELESTIDLSRESFALKGAACIMKTAVELIDKELTICVKLELHLSDSIDGFQVRLCLVDYW